MSLSQPASYRVGARVRVHGLQSRPQHNDIGGTLLSRQADRWQVRLDDATELALRPVNLALEEPPLMPRMFAHEPQVPRQQQPEQEPLQMKMLRTVEPDETSLSVRTAHTLICHRHAQRVSLEKLLVLPEGALANEQHGKARWTEWAANSFSNDWHVDVSNALNQAGTVEMLLLEHIDPERILPCQLLRFSLVCRAWAVGVRAWLVSSAAGPFWRRVCAACLPENVVLHPELCSKGRLLEWVKVRPAVGTRQQWYTCGMGLAEDDETSEAMSELELAVLLAQLFTLWWNVATDEESPCWVGWMRLYFRPWLTGETHMTEANPGQWEFMGTTMPRSLLANVCDCIQDFRGHVQLNILLESQLEKTICALVTRFRCQTAHGVQWRYMPMSAAQNGAFYALLRRYAPLFPQESDLVARVRMPPVFRNGKTFSDYPRPRPLMRKRLPSIYNAFLVLDESNCMDDQEFWAFDKRMSGHTTGSISDEGEEDALVEGMEDLGRPRRGRRGRGRGGGGRRGGGGGVGRRGRGRG